MTLPTTCVLPFGEQEAPAFAVTEYALVTIKREEVAIQKAKKRLTKEFLHTKRITHTFYTLLLKSGKIVDPLTAY